MRSLEWSYSHVLIPPGCEKTALIELFSHVHLLLLANLKTHLIIGISKRHPIDGEHETKFLAEYPLYNDGEEKR
jgi:hypothetical protein